MAGTVASRGWNAGHQAPVGAQPRGGNFDFIILGSQLPRSWALMSLEVVEDKFQALMVVNVGGVWHGGGGEEGEVGEVGD